MKWKIVAGICSLALLSIVALILPPVPATPALHGVVVDQDTHAPIPNAVVVAQVYSDGGWHSSPYPILCTVAQADEEGRFRIPAWSWYRDERMAISYPGVHLTAYHPDYEFDTSTGRAGVFRKTVQLPIIGTPLPSTSDIVIPMRLFSERSDLKKWKSKVDSVIGAYRCSDNQDKKNREVLVTAMRAEVEQLAAFESKAIAGSDPVRDRIWTSQEQFDEIVRAIPPKPVEVAPSPPPATHIAAAAPPRVNPDWPGARFRTSVEASPRCTSPRAPQSQAVLKSASREGTDLVVAIDAATTCGSGSVGEPFAGWRGQSIRFSWRWIADAQSNRAPDCTCTRRITFRVPHGPRPDISIELKPK